MSGDQISDVGPVTDAERIAATVEADAQRRQRYADDGDPVAAGVDPDRATRWAIFDTVFGNYLESVRLRPPTDNMRSDLDRINAEDGYSHKAPRFVWHRV